MTSGAFPGIQADMMMVSACRNKGRLRSIALHQFEAKDSAVEVKRTLQLGDLQMNMTNTHSGIDGLHALRSRRSRAKQRLPRDHAIVRLGSDESTYPLGAYCHRGACHC